MASKETGKDSDKVEARDAASELPRGNRRYATAFLCLCVSTICYAERTNMGIALPALVIDKKEQGEVLSAFFYSYMCTQILGGYLAARSGAKIVLLTVVVWTLFDLSTVVVAKCLTCLLFTRAGMDVGEGILFPCMHQIASTWYPPVAGNAFSLCLALPASSGLWHMCLEEASRPEDDPRITVKKQTFILRNRIANPSTTCQHRAELDVHRVGHSLSLTSIPKKGGLAAVLPYMCGYIGTLLFGRLGDSLGTRGHRALHVRQVMNAFSFLGCAYFLVLLRFANSAPAAVAVLCMTPFTGRAAMAGCWVNMIDVAPNHAAHIMGVSNTFGTIPGIIGSMITGAILHATGSWDLVFAGAALVLVFGATFFHYCASDESIYTQPSYREGYNRSSATSNSFPGSLDCSPFRSSIPDEEESLPENQI
ncbi:unnamed protein product [Hyaloperonospora brassicae]|uniref:Major facilitator superfamily (MFS) profile domain-containing protein n=1 Tax=Hyaloperonospora brassicae TaxID=162125 RepID=A0AAV0TXU2_HYABA|nr:unnamed protein product [Hyaloperonospora brassicae]